MYWSQRKKLIMEKNQKSDFEPSMKSLLRIMKYMSEHASENKTNLSHDTNLNYSRLSEHVAWMEKKGLIELVVEEGKVNISLTRDGKAFASTILKTSA